MPMPKKAFQCFNRSLFTYLNIKGDNAKNAMNTRNAPTSSPENTRTPFFIKIKELPQMNVRTNRMSQLVTFLFTFKFYSKC